MERHPPATSLSLHIEELRVALDRLSRRSDSPVAELVGIDVNRGRPSSAEAAPVRAIDARGEGAIAAPGLHHRAAMVADQLLSWTMGSVKQCRYCGTFGARLEQDGRGHRIWRCRCCRYRAASSSRV